MRFLLTLITFLTFYVSSFAAPISADEAREKAARFIASKKGGSSAARSAQRNGGSAAFGASLTAVDNQEAFYVFNVDSSNGYVIVSGDDRMPDVLGYSYRGSYNRDSIPDNMKAWLQGYVEEYQYLQSHSDAKAASLTSVEGDAILPMIPTHWDQGYPYNAKCPTIGEDKTVTGCVATAMSQIMYYHKWPEQTKKRIPAYTTASISMPAIDITPIDWDNMSPYYRLSGGTETINQAVANIMLLAGCSVKMNYGLGASSAAAREASKALVDYFDYKSSISYESRKNYTSKVWNQKIYNEISNGRPVIYGGQGSGGGHAFIIDGYDKDDYFHVNWGWGGYEDDYFLLSALQDYNNEQEAIIGIEGKGNPEHKYAYAFLDEDNVLTFCYDNERETRTGTVFDVEGYEWKPYKFDWNADEYSNQITTVKFDDSFADYPFMTTMRMMFANMINLTTIEGLTNLNTQNVTDMYGLFYNCQKLESLDLSNFNTENVTEMEQMFTNCFSLTSLDLSSFNTENVTSMYAMFYTCPKLTSLDLSNFNTQKVENMYLMFYNCTNLAFLDLSGFDTQNVTNMSYMFTGCNNVEKIYVDENWTTENVQASDAMFNFCLKLVGQDGTKYEWGKEDATYAHYKEGGLFSCWPKAYAVLENDTLTFCYDILKPERIGTVFSVDMFEWTGEAYRNDITNVTFDAAFVDYKKLTNTATMFSGMEKLATIDGIEYLNTENVTDMSAMFSGCQSLDSLNVSNFDTQKVEDMSSMFSGCQKLDSIDVTKFNTENVIKMSSMFSGCQNLDTLDISNFDTKNVTKMDAMFSVCQALTTIYVGNDWNIESVDNSEEMFLNCLAIVGQDGTTYDEESTDKTKAHYDEGGYLTYKPPYLRGDANSDGKIDMADAMSVSNYILGIPDQKFTIEKADANLDGEINMPDVMFIVNYFLNGKFPDEE